MPEKRRRDTCVDLLGVIQILGRASLRIINCGNITGVETDATIVLLICPIDVNDAGCIWARKQDFRDI